MLAKSDLDHVERLTSNTTSEYLEFNGVLPLGFEGGTIRIATWREQVSAQVIDDLSILFNAVPIFVQCEEVYGRAAIRRVYGESVQTVEDVIAGFDVRVTVAPDGELPLDDLRGLANEAPVIKLVNMLLIEALEARASDVHLESHSTGIRVRYRIDGVLIDAPTPPPHMQAAIISRLKIMAELDIAERRLPQDGRIRLRLQDREVDVRVSTLPMLHGESVVLRMLDQQRIRIDLESLGMAGDTLHSLELAASRPQGIILATGPTGSGSGNREWAYANCSPTWTACGDTTEYTYYDGTNRIGRVATWTAGGPVHTQHTYIYDRNGTVTLDHWFEAVLDTVHKLYRYHDPAGRLGSTYAVNAPSNLYFAYDAFGRKVRGEVQNSSAWMFYDGENTVRFRDHEFLHWPELDAPLIAFFASGSNITCNDAYTSAYVVTVGNRLLDYHSSGTGMSCFGNTSGEYQAWTSVGRHAGAIRDSETFNLERSPGGGSGTGALSFFRNRWYDANTGRFTQEDPIGFAGGLNLYAYAGNNPASYTDPFGLCPWCLGGIGGVVTGFALAKLTGADYDFKDAATDFALGAAGAGIVSKLDKINDARKAATVAKNTLHGAQRLKQAGFTDDLIQLTKGGRNFKQADGANVFLRESSPGRFDFIVESERGVVTAHRNWSQKSIERIARNYGWEW